MTFCDSKLSGQDNKKATHDRRSQVLTESISNNWNFIWLASPLSGGLFSFPSSVKEVNWAQMIQEGGVNIRQLRRARFAPDDFRSLKSSHHWQEVENIGKVN